MQHLINGLIKKEPGFIDLGNHMGNPQDTLLEDLPFDTLENLSEIKLLMARNHAIRKVSDRLGEMKALEWLDLSDNPLEELPESIGNLTSMIYFRVSDTFEVDFDHYMGVLMDGPEHYPKFTSNAGLKTLPQSFGNLNSLQALKLDGNRFEEIPDCIFDLESLTYLDLRGNLLHTISPRIGKLENLTYLKLSRNNFHELPETIGNLKKLNRLRLDSLDLHSLPESIGQLESLQMLEICQGKVANIPVSIQYLKNLTDLYLIDSEISETDLNVIKVFLPHTRIHFELDFG